jgi:hypothetical protein
MRPVAAGGTNSALRVIHSLFMRTADYPLHSRHRSHRMRLNELNDLAVDDGVEPHVAVSENQRLSSATSCPSPFVMPTATLLAR